MTEIAKAYVQIIPTTQGIKSDLADALAPEADASGKKAGKGWASGFAGAAKGVLTTVATGLTAATGAAAALAKNSFDSYKEYEQLVGGVETLFGAGGQSLREFVSASGESIDQATRDYYRLQDAQKTVMENAANAYKTAGLSANDYMETVTSFSASLIQSLGGDTQKAAEYADKAIVDMSDNANKMGTSMESIQNAYQGFAKQNYTMLDNLKLGYGGTKGEMERLIEDAEKINDSFKAQRDASGNLTLSYADVVDAIHIVQENMGITGTTAKEASTTIEGSVNAMKAAWSNLVTGLADDNADIGQLVDDLVTTIIGENGEGGVINNILPAIERILNGIVTMVSTAAPTIVPLIVDIIVDNLPMLIQAGMQVLTALIGGLARALPDLIAAIPEIIRVIITGLADAWPEIKEAGIELGLQLWEGLKGIVSDAWAWGSDLIGNFIDGIWAKAGELWESVKEIARGVKDFLGFSEPKEGPLSNFHTYAPDMMKLFAEGIRDNEYLVQDQIEKSFNFGNTLQPDSLNAGYSQSAGADDVFVQMLALLEDIRRNGVIAKSYLDGRDVTDYVTSRMRMNQRAGGMA